MEVVKKLKRSAYFVTIVYIIIGLIMLLNPIFVRNAVNYIMGIIAIIYGLVYSINLYQKRETDLYSKFDLLGGILCISFGFFLIVNPDVLFSMIPFCTGVILFMDAITLVVRSFNLKKLGFTRWWINLIISGLFLAFSIYIIVNASSISDFLIRVIGGFLIFDSLYDLIITIILSKKVENKITDVTVTDEVKVIETKETE